MLDDYNGSTSVPLNGGGGQYPDIYTGEGSAGNVSINTSDSITENSLKATVTVKGLYLSGPYGPAPRFAHDYSANPAGWQFNTHDHMSFWIKRPTSADSKWGWPRKHVCRDLRQANHQCRFQLDETGGDHYYHALNLPNNGQWTQVILNMHPDHYRGETVGDDPGLSPIRPQLTVPMVVMIPYRRTTTLTL